MSNPEASRFTQSINDDKVRRDTTLRFDSRRIINRGCDRKNIHHSGAQRDGGVGSLRSNTNFKHGLGVHSIAVNPSATSSAERMSLAPEGTVSTNAKPEIRLVLFCSLLQHEFFTHDEQSFLEGMRHPAALKPAETSAPQLYLHRPFSTPSINTVVFCGVEYVGVTTL